MTLSLSIATIAWFSKNFTLWSYDYDTFQPKIGQCANVSDVNFNGSIISDLNLSHLFCISCENDSAKTFEFLNLSEPK